MLAIATTGCGANYGHIPTKHIVMVNTEGHPIDPTGNTSCEQSEESLCNGRHNTLIEYPELTIDQYLKQVYALEENLVSGQRCGDSPEANSYLRDRQDKGLPPRILIFLHGGLNTQTGSVERTAELCKRISAEGYYPIFVNWQSSLFPSYGNHLFHIRQGEDWREGTLSTVGGYLTSPVYLAGDLTRALVRAPIATFFQIRNDVETVPAFRPILSLWSSDLSIAQETAFNSLCRQQDPEQQLNSSKALKEYAALLNKQSYNCTHPGIGHEQDLTKLNLSFGLDKREWPEKSWAFAKYFITLPTKLASAPIIDALGKSAWDIMLRSVSQLFHYDAEQDIHNGLQHRGDEDKNYKSTGALYLFFKELRKAVCSHEAPKGTCQNTAGWEITLVGHSTGAIITHHIIRDFPELPIKNIVYMGAASSIRDYQETVFPYITEKNKDVKNAPCATLTTKQEPTCVYHLMLHETAESGEWLWDSIDPFPRGSLLIWLDNFLSHPLSKEDRTMGRFTNFITTVHHTPQSLRPYIHIQKFGVGEAVDAPKKHGDFGQKLKFWDPKCWTTWPKQNDCYKPNGHY